jgi:hypothetical protein
LVEPFKLLIPPHLVVALPRPPSFTSISLASCLSSPTHSPTPTSTSNNADPQNVSFSSGYTNSIIPTQAMPFFFNMEFARSFGYQLL